MTPHDAVQYEILWSSVWIASAVVSAFTCGYILLVFCLGRSNVHIYGILERQIVTLCVADFAYVTVRSSIKIITLVQVLGTPIFLHGNAGGTAYCKVTHFLYTIPLLAAWFTEAHIAVCFACAIYGSLPSLHKLSKILPGIWILSLALSLWDSFEVDYQWHPAEELPYVNGYCKEKATQQNVQFGTYLVSLAVAVLSYMAAVWRMRRAGLAARDRVWRRAFVFPLIFFALNFPLVPGFLNMIPGNTSLYWNVVGCVANLNGFFNVFAYAWSSRRMRKLKLGCCPNQSGSVPPNSSSQSTLPGALVPPESGVRPGHTESTDVCQQHTLRDPQFLQLQFEDDPDILVISGRFRYDEDIVLVDERPAREVTERAWGHANFRTTVLRMTQRALDGE